MRWAFVTVLFSAVFTAAMAGSSTNSTPVELTGQIVPGANTNEVRLKTSEGAIYKVVRNGRSEALFVDTNLWPKTLMLKSRMLANDRIEVVGNLHSLRDGKRYELFYYCDVCSIKTSDPSLCMCCREPVHLVERPVWRVDEIP